MEQKESGPLFTDTKELKDKRVLVVGLARCGVSLVHFLTECFRVAKPGATIRLVLPDFEEMCATYLDCRKAGDHAEADFLILEIIDQCVRPRRGGKLRDFFGSLDPRKACQTDAEAA